MKEIISKITEKLKSVLGKTDKRITVITLASFILAAVLILCVFVGRKPNAGEDESSIDSETPRPPVHITVPQESEDEVSGEDTEFVPGKPYEGRQFTVLLPNTGAEFFGEEAGGDEIEAKAYERNIAFCRETGADIVFRYSINVYDEFKTAGKAGIGDIDLVIMNMKKEGARFLMSGMISDMLSDVSKKEVLGDFGAYEINGKTRFLLGNATPSLLTSRIYLKVVNDFPAAEELSKHSQLGTLTYESLFAVLKESETYLSMNEETLHALASGEGFFFLSQSGESAVDSEKYTENIEKLFAYKDRTVEGESAISLGRVETDGNFLYLNLPKSDVGEEYKIHYDTAFLYPAAIPKILEDGHKTEFLVRKFFELSEELTAEICKEYRLTFEETREECYYDLFGWGDFSSHAYNAWREGSVSSLKSKLEDPKKVALQALLILFERCK